jgi:hypothetical protein
LEADRRAQQEDEGFTFPVHLVLLDPRRSPDAEMRLSLLTVLEGGKTKALDDAEAEQVWCSLGDKIAPPSHPSLKGAALTGCGLPRPGAIAT